MNQLPDTLFDRHKDLTPYKGLISHLSFVPDEKSVTELIDRLNKHAGGHRAYSAQISHTTLTIVVRPWRKRLNDAKLFGTGLLTECVLGIITALILYWHGMGFEFGKVFLPTFIPLAVMSALLVWRTRKESWHILPEAVVNVID